MNNRGKKKKGEPLDNSSESNKQARTAADDKKIVESSTISMVSFITAFTNTYLIESEEQIDKLSDCSNFKGIR